MSNQRIVSFAYFFAAIMMVYVFGDLLTQLWAQMRWTSQMFGSQLRAPWMVSIGIVAVVMLLVLRHERVNPFLLEVVAELKEVSWPTWEQVKSHTRVVIVFVLIIATILGGFDMVWAKVSKFLLNPSI